MMAIKVCGGCRQSKAPTAFFPSKATSDGLHDHCIPCAKAIWKARSAERDARRVRLNKNLEISP